MATSTEAAESKSMKLMGRRLLAAAIFLVTLFGVWAASLLLHEIGHGLAAELFGGKVVWLRVRPGIELWPPLARRRRSAEHGHRRTGVYPGSRLGREQLAGGGGGPDGSGFNLLLAALALGALWLFRPRADCACC